jgi:hypothetical protein
VRLRLPDTAELSAASHLGVLAVLEASLIVAARATRAAVPAVEHVHVPGELPELTAARILVDECGALLGVIDDHRTALLARQRRSVSPVGWPR